MPITVRAEYYFWHSARLKCSDLQPRSCKNLAGNMLDPIHIKSGSAWILESLAQSRLDDSCIPACFQTGSICPQNLKIPIWLWWCLNWNHDLLIQWKILSDCDGVWIETMIFWSAVTKLHANSTIGTSPLLFNFIELVSTSHVPLLRSKCRVIYLNYDSTGHLPSVTHSGFFNIIMYVFLRNTLKDWALTPVPADLETAFFPHHDLITYRSLSNMPIISLHVSLLKGDQLPFIKACCSSCAVIFPEWSWSTVCQNKRAKCAPRQRSLSQLIIKTCKVCTETQRS